MRLALIIPPGVHPPRLLRIVALSVARKHPGVVIYSKWETLAERQMQHQLRRFHVATSAYEPRPELPKTVWGWVQGLFRKAWDPLDEVDGVLIFLEKDHTTDKILQLAIARKKVVRMVRLGS